MYLFVCFLHCHWYGKHNNEFLHLISVGHFHQKWRESLQETLNMVIIVFCWKSVQLYLYQNCTQLCCVLLMSLKCLNQETDSHADSARFYFISDITLQWLIQHSKSRRSWKCGSCLPAVFAMLSSCHPHHSAMMYSCIFSSHAALSCCVIPFLFPFSPCDSLTNPDNALLNMSFWNQI